LRPALDATFREALAARLRFYRDLGITEFYRRPVDLASGADSEPVPETALGSLSATAGDQVRGPDAKIIQEAPHLDSESGDGSHTADTFQENELIPPRKPIPVPPILSPATPKADKAAALRAIQEDIGDCTRCALHHGRNKIVFADGSPNARLMFIGEGPGADEDSQGLPFVGRAGQLLNNMITAMGLKREETYIANVVKCRPPGNRTPEPEEANTCSPFLFRQIDVVRPEVIVALGATAATYLLGQRQPLAGLRGRVHAFRGSKLIVTYHPAFLLRDPRQKKEAWADLQIAMRELGLKVPGRA
jgi:DNA polymerase